MAYVISDDCVACGTCIDECPVSAISAGDKYSINPDECTECGTCASVCPNEAISLPEYRRRSILKREICGIRLCESVTGFCLLYPFLFLWVLRACVL